VQRDITTTWLGMVGPGVKKEGVTNDVWSDHTDIRPTILSLVGLTDDYSHDGRTLAEVIRDSALPGGVRSNSRAFILLARAYKQIMAPVGQFGRSTLAVSTTALAGNDSKYTKLENRLAALGNRRDALAARIIQKLEAAEFSNQPLDWPSTFNLILQANQLLEQASGD
jgi:hypothetical protein